MKLLKKLLPIASVAGVAAVVTPLVTSCGSGMKFDGDDIYIPTIAKAVADEKKHPEGYNPEQALDLYFSDLEENPEIFAQDMYHALSFNLFQLKNNVTSTVATKSYVDVSLKYTKIVANKKNHTLSYDLCLNANLNLYITGRTSGFLNAKDLKLEMSAKNLPYGCRAIRTAIWDIYTSIGSFANSSNANDVSIWFKANGSILGLGESYCFSGMEITVDKDFDPTYAEEIEAEYAEGIFAMFLGGMTMSMDSPLMVRGPGSYHLSSIPTA